MTFSPSGPYLSVRRRTVRFSSGNSRKSAMKPSRLRTSAMPFFRREPGMSTVRLRIELAFRTRVSMSAMVSVMLMIGSSPARLLDARDLAAMGHLAEADAADRELADERTGPAAEAAAVAMPRLELRRAL